MPIEDYNNDIIFSSNLDYQTTGTGSANDICIEPIFEFTWQYNFSKFPHAVYSADEWFKAGGIVLPFYPFDLNDGVTGTERLVRFVIPHEVLEQASTDDIVHLLGMYNASPSMFNYPSYLLDYLINNFNSINEMLTRTDFAEVLLENYIKIEFMPWREFDDTNEQFNYELEMSGWNGGISTREIFLACNNTFDQMNDEMRHRTLEAVMEKAGIRRESRMYIVENKPYVCGEILYGDRSESPFFEYIIELQYKENFVWCEENQERVPLLPVGSRWYDYIFQTVQDDELIEYVMDIY
jgi:hypothetical protein